ncbi:protein mono-ADP-ribosyltransferase PARP11-like [Coccinella septempunctata]|uniref:protein mono-ADP-ribosyltransferase PARP11-like n=1 Tax=Coccinella septempunctata TaxID=41139 RepID=UPI001D05E150|nr:protein mono-ADP-ribosyltransferase PARP11-like [Coccinella septempunctata]
MGGLFSSESNVSKARSNSYNNQTPQYRNSSLSTPSFNQRATQSSYREEWNGYAYAYRSNYPPTTSINQYSESIVRKPTSYNPNYLPFFSRVIFDPKFEYKVLPIDSDDYEYRDVKRRITNKHFIVHSIDKIEAPCLETSYRLKKNQKLKSYPYLEELELFHGTKWKNAHSICLDNFNWRFNGKGTGHRFGQGVSFSCNAMYAANYSTDDGEKVMFIAKVLIGKRCKGTSYMELPDEGCDTSTKQDDDIVVVKYEDNEFCPIYKIQYHIAPGYVPMNKRKPKVKLYFD